MKIELIPDHLETKLPENLVELCDRYKASTWFSKLKGKTAREYERYMIALLRSPYGLAPINRINNYTADMIYKRIAEESGITAAKYFVAVWRRIFEFAIKFGYADRNPWRHLEVKSAPARSVSWTEEQVFEAIQWALGKGYKGLAVALCLMYDTGQRPIDILYLTYASIKKDDLGLYVDITQTKRGRKVKPALSLYTIGLLGGEEQVLAQPDDKFVVEIKSRESLNKQFNQLRADKPEFKKLQMRDLRRSALTEMGSASDDLMVSVSGHSDRDMLNIYSVRDRTKALEAQRIRYATRNSKLNTEFKE